MSSLTEDFNRAAAGAGETPLHLAIKSGKTDIAKMLIERGGGLDADDPLAYRDNQADGFKADPPQEYGSDDQADGYKGPPEDDAIRVMKPLQLKKAKKKIVL